MTYATGSIVHKGGGFNTDENSASNIPNTFEYEPEKAKALEFGVKWRSPKAYLNLAAFRTEFDQLQVSSNDGINVAVRNAAEAVSQGVELDAHWRPSEYFVLTSALLILPAVAHRSVFITFIEHSILRRHFACAIDNMVGRHKYRKIKPLSLAQFRDFGGLSVRCPTISPLQRSKLPHILSKCIG